MHEIAEKYLESFRRHVEARIDTALHDVERRPRASEPAVRDVIAQVRAIATRGGKRLRAMLVLAGAEAVESVDGDDVRLRAVVDVAAAVELLQTYLLIHDDWMDDDDVRRGGPTAHVALAEDTGSARLGASCAVLAGDLASSIAHGLLASPHVVHACRPGVIEAFAEMQYDAAFGQVLDVVGAADPEAIAALKTGGYTTTGPLVLGARIAGGRHDTEQALRRFSAPIGVAFQLRDDILGVFGDESKTGKPSGHDLQKGSANAVVAAACARMNGFQQHEFHRLTRSTKYPETVAKARELVRGSGAVEAIEARIDTLRDEALEALRSDEIRPSARGMLTEMATRLTERSR